MYVSKNDTPANTGLPLFEEEALCVHHESSNALLSINVSTFLDKHIANLALAAAQIENETSDLLRFSKTSPPRSVVVSVDMNVVHLSKSITKCVCRLSDSLRRERIQLCKGLIRL